jgi:hypothetical protein
MVRNLLLACFVLAGVNCGGSGASDGPGQGQAAAGGGKGERVELGTGNANAPAPLTCLEEMVSHAATPQSLPAFIAMATVTDVAPGHDFLLDSAAMGDNEYGGTTWVPKAQASVVTLEMGEPLLGAPDAAKIFVRESTDAGCPALVNESTGVEWPGVVVNETGWKTKACDYPVEVDGTPVTLGLDEVWAPASFAGAVGDEAVVCCWPMCDGCGPGLPLDHICEVYLWIHDGLVDLSGLYQQSGTMPLEEVKEKIALYCEQWKQGTLVLPDWH